MKFEVGKEEKGTNTSWHSAVGFGRPLTGQKHLCSARLPTTSKKPSVANKTPAYFNNQQNSNHLRAHVNRRLISGHI